jgi:hypothetical protein
MLLGALAASRLDSPLGVTAAEKPWRTRFLELKSSTGAAATEGGPRPWALVVRVCLGKVVEVVQAKRGARLVPQEGRA